LRCISGIWFSIMSVIPMLGCGRTLDIPPSLETGKVDPLTEEALEKSRAILLTNPGKPASWANMGMVLFDSGQAIEARKCFENAIYLDPQNPRYIYLLGWSFLPDEPESALAHLTNAYQLSIRVDRDNPAPAIRLAETLRALGKDSEARKILQDWQTNSGKHPLADLMLAEIAASRGDDNEARSILDGIPGVIYLAKRMRYLDLTLGFGDKTDRDYSILMEEVRRLPQDPDWPDAYLLESKPDCLGFRGSFRLAEALEAKGRLAEAVPLLKKIWDKTEDARSRVGLVGCYIGMGKWDEAKRFIDIQPQSPHNPVLWARYFLAFGDQFAGNTNVEQARIQFINGLEKLEYNFNQVEAVEALGLKCRLLWRLESWRELSDSCKLYLARNPLHKGAKVFLCLSQFHLNQTRHDCDLKALFENNNHEAFPETTQILKFLVKMGLNPYRQSKIQP